MTHVKRPVLTYLDNETYMKLKELARRQERSVSWILREAVKRYLEEAGR